MTTILERAGASFLRAFGAALLILIPGILAAPNVSAAFALGWAALAAAVAAGLRAIQVFIPQLSFKSVFGEVVGAWVDSFVRAFLGVLIVTLDGWLSAPDLATWRTVGLAAVIGAVTAGIRAMQGLLTPGERPQP